MTTHEPHSHRHRIRRHYEPRIEAGRANYDILDWASPQSQRARFEVLARHVDLAGRSLLDIGCGLGDLLGFLRDRRIDMRYTGVDILDKMVAAARDRHPDGLFIHADIFSQDDQPHQPHQPIFEANSFDVTFCSGAFNLNLDNNAQFLPHAVAEMVRLARHAAVFNLLHHRARQGDETYFYYEPENIPSLVAGLDVTVQIFDDYLHNDFTVICRKK
ncbi:MAG: class I SAM-dependent methyltransferase [Phycisphaerae bacterium]|nr:class I SAM-dependent methyltransferase [Phycisphaerae bacterium]